MNAATPVTRTELKAELKEVEERLRAQMNEQEIRLLRRIEKSETNLLTAFPYLGRTVRHAPKGDYYPCKQFR